MVIDAVHADQIREHGGLAGMRDENALESALARPWQCWSYRQDADLPSHAAAYAFALVRNHPYRDGNKRTGFLALTTFLGINGYELQTTDEDVVVTVLALADGTLSEDELAAWIRTRLRVSRIASSQPVLPTAD